MPSESPSPSILRAIANVYGTYAGLMQLGSHESGLGGSLLYVGELDEDGRTYTVAANIAGAATLSASADSVTLRSAQREGVIDFLVNSLDEALRILKNEIRKHQTVAVAVSVAPAIIEEEMIERGVLPDLAPAKLSSISTSIANLQSRGTKLIAVPSVGAGKNLSIWIVPEAYERNLAAFEMLLSQQLAPGDHLNHRWLHQSPRYLGPSSRKLRSIACDQSALENLSRQIGPPLSPWGN